MQWQIFHPARKILSYTSKGEHFQVSNALSYRHFELMRIDDASKRLATFLSLSSFTQEVIILCE